MLEALEAWYASHCDGIWEQEFGVSISTCEVAGWELRVDLVNTTIAGHELARERAARSPDDWLEVWCDGYTFRAAGGVANLRDMLAAFSSFVERVQAPA
jgi:Immunity protein 53